MEEFKQLANLPSHQTMLRRFQMLREFILESLARDPERTERKQKESDFAKKHGWRLREPSQLVEGLKRIIQQSKEANADPAAIQAEESDLEGFQNHLETFPKPTPEEIIAWNNEFPESSFPTDPNQLVKVFKEPAQGSWLAPKRILEEEGLILDALFLATIAVVMGFAFK
ncbi:hypothetical protein LQW54_010663 [Pestalotiopsis sp. IQ-011]